MTLCPGGRLGEVRPEERAAVRTTAKTIAETSAAETSDAETTVGTSNAGTTVGTDVARRTAGLCGNDWASVLTFRDLREDGPTPVEGKSGDASPHRSEDDPSPDNVDTAMCSGPTEIMVPSAEEVSDLLAQASCPRTVCRGATRTRTPASRSGR